MPSNILPPAPGLVEVPDYPHYMVGADGSVWSCRPVGGASKSPSAARPWRQLSPFRQSRTGRSMVRLADPFGRVREFTVTRLVAMTHGGPEPTDELASFDRDAVIWAAGFFDGEGCVSVQCRKRPANRSAWFSLSVRITNTHLGAIDRLREVFGFGTTYKYPPRPGRQQVYAWITADRAAEVFLRAVSPFVVVKREQSRLALEFRSLGQKRPFQKVAQADWDLGASLALRVRELNGINYRKSSPLRTSDYIEV